MRRAFMAPLVAVALMTGSAVLGTVGRPSVKAEVGPAAFKLDNAIPAHFGEWSEVRQEVQQVVNPQTQELLDKLYSQLLTRVYRNREGERVMLSMAYGGDQRGKLQAHLPEVCYPAQGFELRNKVQQDLQTSFGSIPVTRLETRLGQRHEPVSYWFTLGDKTLRSSSRWEKRWVEIRFGLTGEVPGGLLFRVSSLDGDASRAYGLHDRFILDLLTLIGSESRAKLLGQSNS
jgi:EpsI family protein